MPMYYLTQSYVSSDFSRKLNLRCVEKIEHKYATFGGNQSQTDQKAVREIVMLDKETKQHRIRAIEVPVICSKLRLVNSDMLYRML